MSIKKGYKVIAGAPLEAVWGNISGDITDQADLQQVLSEKVGANSPAFTGTPTAPTPPTGSYDDRIATTSYVQQAIESVDALPSQTGQNGKFLTTDGTDASWATVNALPSQSGQSGKFLTTNGTSASWSKLPEEIFIATYNSTTYSEISTAYNAGKICYVNWEGIPVALSKLGLAQAKFLSLINKYAMINITVTSEDVWSNNTLYFSIMTQDANKVLITDSTGESTTSSVTSTELGYLSGITSSVQTQLNDKQPTLVSGTNIKTINNTSILGSGNIDTHELPSQTGQNGKFLTTNGTSASWANIPTEIPSQTGQNGKFLTTNGTTASWATVDALPTQAGNANKFLTTDGTYASWETVNQMTATYDSTNERITWA